MTVGNGKAAVADVLERNFDVALMKVQMPLMDGFEANSEFIKRKLQRPPIIAMTADAVKEDCQRCLDGGMDGYLSKPIMPNRLYEAIAAVLGKPVSHQPLETNR